MAYYRDGSATEIAAFKQITAVIASSWRRKKNEQSI
jgi:hypothetical protein